MAKFTTIEDLIDEAYQSIAGAPPTGSRVELGTKTLDNRDFWENINFNEDTFRPYLTGNLEILETEVRDGIVYRKNIETSTTYQYSVDALPFVTDPNNDDEIIRLDEYYDKKNNSNEYYLATEGKINYYLYARESGRPTPDGHIDNYTRRNAISRFDSYAQNEGDTGFYLFKLNWGDGTSIEYTDNPKLLEGSVLLEHFYEKPGFYTISGVVYALYSPEDQQSIGGYERFETNILLNPSKTYEFDLYDYDNFATIGGISLDSTLIKSSLNTIGINPINPLDDQRASSENIEKLNLFDKLQLFNFLNKVSDSFLNKFEDLLEPYSVEFDATPTVIEPIVIQGCMNPNADNYNSEAVEDDGSCRYSFVVNVTTVGAPYGYTSVSGYTTFNPTIPYNTLTSLIDEEGITLFAAEATDGEFTGWEIISGDNFQDGTIQLSDVTSLETELTVTREADFNNYGTITVAANFIETQNAGGSQVVEELNVIGQDLNLAEYGRFDEDDNEYDVTTDNGIIQYPMDPQPVGVYGAPYTGDSGIPNQSSLGLVGPTNFILMDNVISEYTEPGHPWENSEIELYQRIIEARPNPQFELDGVTYTQSFSRWEVKQGVDYIERIFDGEGNNIVLQDNFILASTYGEESIKTIIIEYSATNYDPNTPIIIEGYFQQVDEDGNDGNGKQPGG